MNFFDTLGWSRLRASTTGGLLAAFGLMLAGTATHLRAAVPPAYLRQALADFNPGVPPGWAYTVTTEQDTRRTTERFDPAKPPREQWQLLLIDDRAPTEDESSSYQKYKANQTPGAAQATYTTADIEPFSLQLVKEDAQEAEFLGGFRAQAASGDKMLSHLRLRLFVRKQPASVRQATLELIAPYSPVLTVKMNALVASTEFTPATDTHPALPVRSASRFAGRMFFFSVEENLRLTYANFARTP